MSSSLLPLFYLPPISWFSIYEDPKNDIILEKWEHFPKQTYRNRAVILAANGPLVLSVPKKKQGTRKPIKDIEISYHEDWQRMHWKSIKIAYQTTPYFEFYEDKLATIYSQKDKFLFDFNLRILAIIKETINSNVTHQFSSTYQKEVEAKDFRDKFSTKKESEFIMEEYYQSFNTKFGFIKDLSIIDLLCNKGPEATTYLKNIKLKDSLQ